MSGQSKGIFKRLYKSAKQPEDLPWHEADPPTSLVKALGQRAFPGRALDVGCGAGTYSIYMAERGYQVTAIDFMPQAVEMLQQGIAGRNLSIEVMQADVGLYTTTEPFDIVLDVGCLHTPGTIALDAYKAQLLDWLAPGGDFILTHFGRRGWWDWWPIGPNRVYAQVLEEIFAPELKLVEDVSEERHDLPLFIGRSGLFGRYWFKRN
jgi:SAM-dependent methyltransferase